MITRAFLLKVYKKDNSAGKPFLNKSCGKNSYKTEEQSYKTEGRDLINLRILLGNFRYISLNCYLIQVTIPFLMSMQISLTCQYS